MSIPRMTVQSLFKMACVEAQRLSKSPAAEATSSPILQQAVAQVWSMVKDRLGKDPRVQQMDELIAKLTSTKFTDASLEGK